MLDDHYSCTLRKYPKINLKLRAPIELENMLPYDVQYRVYDKDSNQNWRSFLRKGGIMPVHSVELEHLVLLNVEIQETCGQFLLTKCARR
jgi:vacuolar protein sorting-associated protein 13A/C